MARAPIARRVIALCVVSVVHFLAPGPARSQEVDLAIVGTSYGDQWDAAGMVKRTVLEFRLDGSDNRHERAEFFAIKPRSEVDRSSELSTSQRDRTIAQSRGYIGAFAFSESTGDYGWASHYTNSGEAAGRALRQCRAQSGAGDCKIVEVFGGLCAAFTVMKLPAKGKDGKDTVVRLAYVGKAPDHPGAQAAGLEECKKNMLKPELKDLCKVIKVICSDQLR